MPRPPRTHAIGVVHHVMIRGVDGRAIFLCVFDYEDFLARFARLVRELGFVVLGWCLLGNHAHFVLKSGTVPLAALMARLNARHAQRINRSSGRSGHLFQARYEAVLIETHAQLVATIPYVIGNAARHGLTTPERSADYRWSMHGALAGRRSAWEFEDPRAIAQALNMDPGTVHSMVERVALEPASIGAALEPDQLDELDRLIRACCERHGLDRDALRSRRTHAQRLRAEVCVRAARALDLPLSEIARHTGISYTTVWRLAQREMANRGLTPIRHPGPVPVPPLTRVGAPARR
jgi:REP element-mobilizing transposase RayT